MEDNKVEPIFVSDSNFRSNYLHLKDLYSSNQTLVERVTAELEAFNKSLKLTNAHIGYRVRDEICFYMDYNENSELMSFEKQRLIIAFYKKSCHVSLGVTIV